MKKILLALAALVMTAGAVPAVMQSAEPVAVAAVTTKADRFPARPDQPSDVKVVVTGGHGSAVHIGNGYFLTACHVVATTKAAPKVKLHDGSVREAETLWCNPAYDIALLRAPGEGVAVSALQCSLPAVGDNITLTGNPLVLENITSFARVAGGERSLSKWKSVFIADGAIVPGQSGGAAFNEKREVVGITVGVVMWPLGLSATTTGYGTIVPGKTICGLLARA